MLELDKKVLGSITLKEIIGAHPPIHDMDMVLEETLDVLLVNLKLCHYSKERLKEILDAQKAADTMVNCRPGAMALAQGKIQLYNKYNKRYLLAIADKLG